MRRPKRMGRKKSKRLFSRTAAKVHPRNAPARAMRGGIRL